LILLKVTVTAIAAVVAIVAATGTMVEAIVEVDHITEMAIVTAMDKTVAAEAVGQLLLVRGMAAVAVDGISTTVETPVGRNPMEEDVGVTEAAVAPDITVGMMAVQPRRTTGLFRCRGTKGQSPSCSKVAMGLPESTSIGTRTFQSRQLEVTCPMALRM
jgi:hypothetical protein